MIDVVIDLIEIVRINLFKFIFELILILGLLVIGVIGVGFILKCKYNC